MSSYVATSAVTRYKGEAISSQDSRDRMIDLLERGELPTQEGQNCLRRCEIQALKLWVDTGSELRILIVLHDDPEYRQLAPTRVINQLFEKVRNILNTLP